jgi:hypothetical protein
MSKAKGSKREIDFGAILGRISDAKAIIHTGCIVSEQLEGWPPEAITVRAGLNMLERAYDELDRAIAGREAQ